MALAVVAVLAFGARLLIGHFLGGIRRVFFVSGGLAADNHSDGRRRWELVRLDGGACLNVDGGLLNAGGCLRSGRLCGRSGGRRGSRFRHGGGVVTAARGRHERGRYDSGDDTAS